MPSDEIVISSRTDLKGKRPPRIVSLGDSIDLEEPNNGLVTEPRKLPRLVSLGESLATEHDDMWVCPICCQSLKTRMEEIGAFTHQGVRVEPALYHGGCISMMLLHARQRSSSEGTLQPNDIDWGVSPVTRRAVDGFLRMPHPSEEQRWLDFFDWQGTGHYDYAELVLMVSSVFSVQSTDVKELLLQGQTSTGSGNHTMVSRSTVESTVLPFLIKACRPDPVMAIGTSCDVHTPKEKPETKTFGNMVARFNVLMPSDSTNGLTALRATCIVGCVLARLLAVQDAAWYLRHRASIQLADVAALLCEVACPGDSTAIRVAIWLLGHADAALRGIAADLLSNASTGDQVSMRALIPRLADEHHQARDSAKNALQKLSNKADKHALSIVRPFLQSNDPAWKRLALSALAVLAQPEDKHVVDVTTSFLKDDDQRVRIAACKTLPLLVRIGNAQTIDALLSRLNDFESRVQVAVFHALAALAPKGDRRVVREMVSTLKQVRQHCRATADARGQLPLVCLLECGVKVLGECGSHVPEALEFCRSLEEQCHPRIMSAAKSAVQKLSVAKPGSGEQDHSGGCARRVSSRGMGRIMWPGNIWRRCGRRALRASDVIGPDRV